MNLLLTCLKSWHYDEVHFDGTALKVFHHQCQLLFYWGLAGYPATPDLGRQCRIIRPDIRQYSVSRMPDYLAGRISGVAPGIKEQIRTLLFVQVDEPEEWWDILEAANKYMNFRLVEQVSFFWVLTSEKCHVDSQNRWLLILKNVQIRC